MPMDFPDIHSLEMAARCWHYRSPYPNETDVEYRLALAKYVAHQDIIEAYEIKFGVGWDRWSDAQKVESLSGNLL
jgi:hypothetical protein